MAFITTCFFFVQALKWLENGGAKVLIVTCIFLRLHFLHENIYKSDIIFSVFLSLDQNLMKLGNRIIACSLFMS